MMENENEIVKVVHMGRNIAKFRHLKGYKQGQFAEMIGLNNQQAMSKLESKKVIDVKTLEKIAPLLGVSVEVLQTMPEDASNIIIEHNTFEEGSGVGVNMGNDYVFNNNYHPTDQLIELIKERDRKEQARMEGMQKQIKDLEAMITGKK